MSGGPVVLARLTLRRRQDDALAPTRAALLGDAQAEADRIRAEARRAAELLLAQARASAVDEVSRAQADGRALAEPIALAEEGRGRRAASQIVLAARRRARAALEDRIRAAITGLRHQPGYRDLLARLSDLAGQVAGSDAVVSEHSAGGAFARAPGVVVDCSLPRLADHAIAELGPRIRSLSEL